MQSRYYTRRSPVSTSADLSQVERNLRGLDPVTEDPRAPYLVAQRTPAEPDARAFYSDRLYTLRTLARAACPGATGLKASSSWEEDGFHPATFLFCVELTSPDIDGVVSGQGVTPELATQGLKKKWALARRACATRRVVEECIRLSQGYMTDTQRATLRDKLLACPYDAFEALAAKARKQAQGLAPAAESQEYWSHQPAA